MPSTNQSSESQQASSGHTSSHKNVKLGIGDMPMLWPDVKSYFSRLNFAFHTHGVETALDKKSMLLTYCGHEAFKLIETLFSPQTLDASEISFDNVRAKVEAHFKPKLVVHYERHLLHGMLQGQDSIADYVAKLKQQAGKCEFPADIRESLILSQLIFGLSSSKAREKILAESEITLDQAIQMVLLEEQITKVSTPQSSVNFVSDSNSVSTSNNSSKHFIPCKFCGEKHEFKQGLCPAWGKTCPKCHRKGHLPEFCSGKSSNSSRHGYHAHSRKSKHNHSKQSSKYKSSSRHSKHVHNVERSDSDSDTSTTSSEVSATGSCNKISSTNAIWDIDNPQMLVNLNINNYHIPMLYDTGAGPSLITENVARKCQLKIFNTTDSLRAYNGSAIKLIGICYAKVRFKKRRAQSVPLYVVTDNHQNIAGRSLIRKLKIPVPYQSIDNIEIIDSVVVAQNNGKKFLECDFHFKKDYDTTGMRFAARGLPFSYKVLAEAELMRLLRNGVISRVTDVSKYELITPLVCVPKSKDRVRLCPDFSVTLNKIIDKDSYHTPILSELLEKLAGCKRYTTIDLSDAYLHIKLSDTAKKYTCIATHIGHFIYNSMPYGVSAAPLIFQEGLMEHVLGDIPGVAVYVDDICIGGKDSKEVQEKWEQVRKLLESYSFDINYNKCHFDQEKVNFLGFTLHDGKMIPNDNKVRAFRNLKSPTDKNELHSVLSSLRHYGHFCKHFSILAADLYEKLRKNTHFFGLPRMKRIIVL